MILQDLTKVDVLPGEGFRTDTKLVIDTGPEIDYVRKIREANSVRQRGFSDQRNMKFRAHIPAELVWYYEQVLGWNLADKKDFRKFLDLYPEFIVAPEDTGRTGHIIVKGD